MDANCGKCGAGLTTAQILFDERGTVVCEKCLLGEQAKASQQQAAATVKAIAYSGPFVGLAAFFWNPWWLISVAAIGNGIYVFRSLRDAEDAVRTSHTAEKMKVAAIAGMVLGGITAVLQLLRMMGKLAG
jgi:uncharacterized membrane protein